MVWRFLKKLGIKPPYDPVIPLLGICPKESKIERDTCVTLFIAALFATARTRKQPRYPSTEEWIKKWWYIYTMDYYSAIKRNTFESILMRWMNLEPIIQSEVSQKKKDNYCILIARRDKKAFLSDQCKEIDENNRMGKTRKLEIPREYFMQR